MPHAIDFDDIEQKLFLLQQLCNGSESFCRKHQLSEEDTHSPIDWIEYAGRLKGAVSNYMIDSAIKTRVTQDFLADYEYQDIDLRAIETESIAGIYLGHVEEGRFTLNIRESCNKVIHALEAGLVWVHDSSGIDFWSGAIRLAGKHGGKPWVVLLEVENWALALANYHRALESEVDWMSIWENDE